jgi:hypothetical protein
MVFSGQNWNADTPADALLFCKDGQSNDLALPEHLDAPCPEMVMIAIYCHPIGHGG